MVKGVTFVFRDHHHVGLRKKIIEIQDWKFHELEDEGYYNDKGKGYNSTKNLLSDESDESVESDESEESDIKFLNACEKGYIDFVQMNLMAKKVNINAQYKSKQPSTPLHIAIHNSDIELLELLLKYKADPCVEDTGKMTTALHRLCLSISKVMSSRQRDCILNMIKLVLNYQTNVNKEDKLHVAPVFGLFDYQVHKNTFDSEDKRKMFQYLQKDILKMLLEAGVEVTSQSKQERTLLDLVISSCSSRDGVVQIEMRDEVGMEMIELLLEHEVDVTAKSRCVEMREFYSPLHLAVNRYNFDAVKKLCQLHPNVSTIRFNKLLLNDRPRHVMPTAEIALNLINIMMTLNDNNYQFNVSKDLAMIDFLIGTDDVYYGPKQFLSVLAFGSLERIRKFFDLALSRDEEHLIKTTRKYLAIVRKCEMYKSQEMMDFLLKKANVVEDSKNYLDDFNIDLELQRMKSLKISKKASLYDVCKLHPKQAYFDVLINSDYRSIVRSAEFDQMFPECARIIRGHLVRAEVNAWCDLSVVTLAELHYDLTDAASQQLISYASYEDKLSWAKQIQALTKDVY
ncbi:uncharacterized protein LOC106650397 [Trichogramma pretiosum]|uniref:uncharacterized protein LOC106650397 n=1 Tax=Trichogramma pretiosum TaxID=7493 RepID=UPI0006C99277|nr:uncharacterized protein LOC106650397 [Trichogramma pretiosum]